MKSLEASNTAAADPATSENAIILSTTITRGQVGCLTSWLQLQRAGKPRPTPFGGFAMYQPEGSMTERLNTTAGHFMFRIMEVAGVENWNEVAGKPVRIRLIGDRVIAVGHIMKDDWFAIELDLDEAWREKQIKDAKPDIEVR